MTKTMVHEQPLEKRIDERSNGRPLCEHDKEPQEDQDEQDWTEPPFLPYAHIGPEFTDDGELGPAFFPSFHCQFLCLEGATHLPGITR